MKLGTGLDDTSLWFKKDSNNALEIDILGTSDKIMVDSWFNSSSSSPLSEIIGGNGLEIDDKIAQLVSAMATFQADNTAFDPGLAANMPDDSTLQSVIAASWHSAAS